jgi:hypothetical protein
LPDSDIQPFLIAIDNGCGRIVREKIEKLLGIGRNYDRPEPGTLESYLVDAFKRQVIDHAVRARTFNGETEFYIHPAGKDGDTPTFRVIGNRLVRK